MENFKFHCPTKIIFGRDTEENVGDEIKILGGKKVLLHYYSDEIIKDIGLYSKVIESLLKNKIKYIEFSGAVPNPRLNLVKKGITICRAENIDFILAIGGGSVIDSAKMIAAGVFYKGDPWDFCMMKASPKKALNLGVILTIAASGSESSRYSVITNEEDWFKKGFTSDLIRPKFAILNPEITFSVPPYHKFSGIIDIISHITERYFTRDDDYTGLLDLYCEATLRNIIEQSKIILNNPNDYNANAEIMWASTIAQNDLLGVDIKPDWEVHVM